MTVGGRARAAVLAGTALLALSGGPAVTPALPVPAVSTISATRQAGGSGTSPEPLPAAVDWRSGHAVTPVQDKGQCDEIAGRAYATAAVLEGAWVVQSRRRLTSFTPVITDASGEDVFPRLCGEPRPPGTSEFPVEAFQRWVPVASGDEDALRAAVARGPVRARIDTSQVSFALYSAGVYDEPLCSSARPDHSIAVVGYGTTPAGVEYWIVKNDYGARWGEEGFALMSRDRDNQCGIATEAEEAVLNPAPYTAPFRNPWPVFP
ncbi:C1 family peptidase [Streptomyces sp. NPDC001985]|uniref:C1 family peptidase n=1 Tax=Streptomyces sp. NPDC001985 TaxID=3154406 RepID=UPI00332D94DA